MQQKQEGGERRLAVLAAERNYGAARAGRIVVYPKDLAALPRTETDRLADVTPLRDAAIGFDPVAVPLAPGGRRGRLTARPFPTV
jgi:hypothetical protein